MLSDDASVSLKVLRIGRDGVHYFRFDGPSGMMLLDADLASHDVPTWRVLQIVSQEEEAANSILLEEEKIAPEIRLLIVDALQDFGIFYGQRAGEVEVIFALG